MKANKHENNNVKSLYFCKTETTVESQKLSGLVESEMVCFLGGETSGFYIS